jgi:hypothetical protein
MQINKLIIGVLFALGASSAYANCTTQTLIVGGKMQVCTVCGTVVSCM